MPLPGGASDKMGNRYEGKWAVLILSKILSGEYSKIYIEPVGEDGDGIEFTVTSFKKVTCHHQVKRQNAQQGKWSIKMLIDRVRKKELWHLLDDARKTAIQMNEMKLRKKNMDEKNG